MKIAVCGPPHSGKSVFLGGLCENLPRGLRYLFRACPDGEGTWTYKGNGSEGYRRKGEFSPGIVDWYCQSLANCKMAEVILIDIGGIPSKENRRILTEGEVNHAIILAGDMGKVSEWEQFLEECQVRVITTIHSDYHGIKDETEVSPMVVHHLERGDESVESRPAIRATAEIILNLITEEEVMKELMNGDILEITGLAKALGKKEEEKTLPNGRVVNQITWEGSDLVKIAELLHHTSGEMPEVVRINGAAPAWLVSALVHECHPRAVELNSPDGYIGVGGQKARGEGKGIDFLVENREDGWVQVTFTLNPSIPLSAEMLDSIAPPELPMGSKVILSGRGPNWLVASLAMGYHGRAKAVACFQPGTGATVCWTHSDKIGLGELIS